jgi:hypothetical protein
MSEPPKFIQKSLQKSLEANGIPVSLDPESNPITCAKWCGFCRGTNPGCRNPPGEKERQQYVGSLRSFMCNCNHDKHKNLSILHLLKLCGTSSRKHWTVFSYSGIRLSEKKNLESRRIVELRQIFTEVPIELLNRAEKIARKSLSRQQWKVLLPTLQDHFPSVPRKFYLLLIKLSLGLGFLTKQLCGRYPGFCEFILGRCLTPRLVRSKYARALKLWSWEKPEDQPYWLDIFFSES